MRSMQILVVDDDRDSAEGLAEVLEFSGHDVTLAFDGPAAVEMVHRQPFDVAFMDIMMPSMNGIESLIEFQKIRPGIKVLMMTGYSLEELIAKATDNGALGVLKKPIDLEDIFKFLEGLEAEGPAAPAAADLVSPLGAEAPDPNAWDRSGGPAPSPAFSLEWSRLGESWSTG